MVCTCRIFIFFFFFFNDTATTEIYTLSLHDALPIPIASSSCSLNWRCVVLPGWMTSDLASPTFARCRSEEHTSELQSQFHLVCRLLLEKKKNIIRTTFLIKKQNTKRTQ